MFLWLTKNAQGHSPTVYASIMEKCLKNVQFEVNEMHFDAAIDYCHEMHAYSPNEIPEGCIPVELYNLDYDWDIKMIYPKANADGDVNEQDILYGIYEWIADDAKFEGINEEIENLENLLEDIEDDAKVTEEDIKVLAEIKCKLEKIDNNPEEVTTVSQDDIIHFNGGFTPKDVIAVISAMGTYVCHEFDAKTAYNAIKNRIPNNKEVLKELAFALFEYTV